MTEREYTLSDFYLHLKLGIWYTGVVEDWGLVQKIDVYPDGRTNKGCFVEVPEKYKQQQTTGREFCNGLRLLGFYPLDIQQPSKPYYRYKLYNYLIVISECRLKGTFEENIYHLKVTNHQPLEEFVYQISDKPSKVKRGRRKIKDPKVMSNNFRNNPVYSVTRRY